MVRQLKRAASLKMPGAFMKVLSIFIFILLFFSHLVAASQDSMQGMHGMQHNAHQQPSTFIGEILHHSTAGTSAQPNSTDEPMIMRSKRQMAVYVPRSGFFKRIAAKRAPRL